MLRDIAEPDAAEGQVLIETLAVGLCGTDTEITSGAYREAPARSPFLILGHENLGRVLDAVAGINSSYMATSSAKPTPTAGFAPAQGFRAAR